MTALVATAETAQDIAAVLDEFLGPVSDYSTEITALISACYALSSALRGLSTAIGDSRFNVRYHRISEDLHITLLSLEYTFNDIKRLFGGLGRPTHISQSAAYRSVWREIATHFERESGNSLWRRLEYYQSFLLVLACIVEGLAAVLSTKIDFGFTADFTLENNQTGMNSMICDIVLIVFFGYKMTVLQAI